jgi:uncharacterized protein DUF2752
MGKFWAFIFRSRIASLVCLAVVLFAAALPPQGFGVPLCQFKVMTHLPCFSCGLTRSFIGMAHLDIARAAFYHPLGVMLFAVFLFVAVLLPVPVPRRQQLAGWAEGHSLLLNCLAIAFLAVFLFYGGGRILWLLSTSRPSPW